ncbi:MAG TPA: hypothetical protein VGE29_17630 [Prosthecobacter sp.]
MKFFRFAEARVLWFLVLLLGGLEVGARLFEVHLSKDVKHIRSLPDVAAELKAAADSRLKVLIVGNSLSREGLDAEMLKQGLAARTGREVELAAMYPDGSNISQWYYGYRRYFDQTGAKPHLVIIGTSRPHLLDAPAEPDRLAAFYTSLQDMPQLLSEQSGDVEAISKAVLARGSMLFAHRGRVQPLVFYNLVPGYTETTQTLAVRREAGTPEQGGEAASVEKQAPAESVRCLSDLLGTFQKEGVKAMLVAIPMPQPYALPESVLTEANKAAVPVLSGGAAMHLEPRYFPDGYHLNAAGAAMFTRRLLEEIEKLPADSFSKP